MSLDTEIMNVMKALKKATEAGDTKGIDALRAKLGKIWAKDYRRN